MRQVTTLAIIEDENRVLLAMKKRGHGQGWWNGYGGKVETSETIEEAMARELKEESGLTAQGYKPRGIIEFYFEGSDLELEMHIFEVTRYTGRLIETGEMRPKWFLKVEVPYEAMWPADREWLTLFLDGYDIYGTATFDSETKKLISSDLKAA